VLVVNLDSGGGAPSAERLATVRTTLAQLASPSVALCTESGSPAAAALLDHFDVVLADEAELAPVLDATRRAPLAAMALVQLLRHSAALDIHEGLIAESLVYSTLQSGPEFRDWLARRPSKRTPGEHLEPAVRMSRSDDCLRLTLNRPERRNAFSAEMRDALVEGLRIAASDPSVTEVVLDGAGASFCSGGDLDEFGTLPDPATAHGIRSTRNAARLLAACADRVRVEVHGACVGAGIELPAFARRVVAAKGAFFQLPEVAMGLVPGAGGTVSIPRRIGRQRTAYLALSGERLDAATALRWGLIDEIRD
jgi:enoyl-CoA hydratase/carnithine racemase